MQTGQQRKFALASDVVAEQLESEMVIVELRTGRYFQLNETGAMAVQLLDAGDDLEAITNSIAERFGAPRADVRRDVNNLVDELEQNGLIAPIR